MNKCTPIYVTMKRSHFLLYESGEQWQGHPLNWFPSWTAQTRGKRDIQLPHIHKSQKILKISSFIRHLWDRVKSRISSFLRWGWYWVTLIFWCQVNPAIHCSQGMHNVKVKTKHFLYKSVKASWKLNIFGSFMVQFLLISCLCTQIYFFLNCMPILDMHFWLPLHLTMR